MTQKIEKTAQAPSGSTRGHQEFSRMRRWEVKAGWFIAAFVISVQAQAATYYFHNDQLGTPQVVTDKDKTAVWKGEYDSFGKVTETVNAIEQNLRFPGQYYDQETGLHYNYFRTYDPNTGRYVESDPIGLAGGINTYSYVGQNPVGYFDYFGLFSCTCINTNGGGGNGTTIAGRKQFSYLCTCECSDGTMHRFSASGGGQGGDSEGQTALGSKLATGVSRAGETYTYAIGFDYFNVDSKRSWFQLWSRGEDTLNQNINSTMSDKCQDDDADGEECPID